ncbi:hypothetical protein [Bartonella sp. SD1336NMGDW]|uniref:hypothetical protein n=1 Tax=Bartonella sp. SD1336NMGDW TaxID=3243575 RepID=UPI0035CEC19E
MALSGRKADYGSLLIKGNKSPWDLEPRVSAWDLLYRLKLRGSSKNGFACRGARYMGCFRIFRSLVHSSFEMNPIEVGLQGHFLENRRIFGKNKKNKRIVDPH